MIARDLHNTLGYELIKAITTVTNADTAIVSSIFDMQGTNGNEFLLLSGGLTDANATFTVLFEHGDAANLSDAAAAPDEDLIGTEAQATHLFSEDDTLKKIGYRGQKRYGRITITPSGNDSGAATFTMLRVKNSAIR